MFKEELGEVKRSGAIFVKSEMDEGFVIHQPTHQVSHLRTFSHFAFSEEEKSVCSIFGFAQLVANPTYKPFTQLKCFLFNG